MAQGSITKHTVGTGDKQRTVYRARLDAGLDAHGTRRQPLKTFATKREAQAWLASQLHRLATGTYTDPTKLTYGAYLHDWLDGPARRFHSNTQRAYASLIRARILPALGAVPIQALRYDRLDRFMRDQETTAGPATLQTLQAILRGSLRDAERANLIPRNPALLLTAPPVPHAEVRAWDADQARRFLAAVTGREDYALYLLLLTTGLRIGEALGLLWTDLALDAGMLTVARTQTHDRAGKLILGDRPKSDHGRRTLPLAAEAVWALRAQRARQRKEQQRLKDVWEDRGLVFPNATGGLCRSGALRDRFTRLCAQTDLPAIGLHGLRRTAGSVLLAQGESLKAAADLLGHARMDVTFQHYIRASDTQRTAAAATLARAVLDG